MQCIGTVEATELFSSARRYLRGASDQISPPPIRSSKDLTCGHIYLRIRVPGGGKWTHKRNAACHYGVSKIVMQPFKISDAARSGVYCAMRSRQFFAAESRSIDIRDAAIIASHNARLLPTGKE